MTIEYGPPRSSLKYGVDVGNIFDQTFTGPVFNGRYQPIATGVAGPLTGQTTNGTSFQGFPGSLPIYTSLIHGSQPYVNVPSDPGRSFYFYINTRL